jgi:hypothetical protein
MLTPTYLSSPQLFCTQGFKGMANLWCLGDEVAKCITDVVLADGAIGNISA